MGFATARSIAAAQASTAPAPNDDAVGGAGDHAARRPPACLRRRCRHLRSRRERPRSKSRKGPESVKERAWATRSHASEMATLFWHAKRLSVQLRPRHPPLAAHWRKCARALLNPRIAR